MAHYVYTTNPNVNAFSINVQNIKRVGRSSFIKQWQNSKNEGQSNSIERKIERDALEQWERMGLYSCGCVREIHFAA